MSTSWKNLHDKQVQVTDGTDTLAINGDGSINVVQAGGVTSTNTYNEITSVAGSTLSTIVTYTATGAAKLKFASGSGTNIAKYEVAINGSTQARKYTNFGTNLSADFDFLGGLPLTSGDVVIVRVIHLRAAVGDFNGNIIIET